MRHDYDADGTEDWGTEDWQRDAMRQQENRVNTPVIRDLQYERLVRKDADVKHLTCAETAKLVRAALKEHFPGVTFSVKSHVYSGGASVDVNWTDGPTVKEVDAIVKRFEGATFDGMIDLKSYNKPVMLDGRRVSFGADYVMCHRDLSYDLLLACAERIAEQYGVPAPEVKQSTYTHRGKTHTHAWVERDGAPLDRYASGAVADYASTPGDKALQLAYATSAYHHEG